MDKATKQLKGLLNTLQRYVVVICIIIFGAMYGYLIYTSGSLIEQEPGEFEITEQYKGTPRPKIDESAAEKLVELEDQNIEVQTLFNNARNNPFAE